MGAEVRGGEAEHLLEHAAEMELVGESQLRRGLFGGVFPVKHQLVSPVRESAVDVGGRGFAELFQEQPVDVGLGEEELPGQFGPAGVLGQVAVEVGGHLRDGLLVPVRPASGGLRQPEQDLLEDIGGYRRLETARLPALLREPSEQRGQQLENASRRNQARQGAEAARFPVEIKVDAGEKRLFRTRQDPVGVVFAGIDEERLPGLLEKRLSRFRQQQLEIAPDRQNQFMVRQPASGPLCGGRNREIRVMDGRFDFFQLHKRLLSDI